MKKADVLIALAIVFLALLFLFFASKRDGDGGRLSVQISVGGEIWDEFPLPDEPQERTVPGLGGNVHLLIEPDGVRVLSADCPEQTCVNTGKITSPSTPLVCLAHRVVIRLIGRVEGDVDVTV